MKRSSGKEGQNALIPLRRVNLTLHGKSRTSKSVIDHYYLIVTQGLRLTTRAMNSKLLPDQELPKVSAPRLEQVQERVQELKLWGKDQNQHINHHRGDE